MLEIIAAALRHPYEGVVSVALSSLDQHGSAAATLQRDVVTVATGDRRLPIRMRALVTYVGLGGEASYAINAALDELRRPGPIEPASASEVRYILDRIADMITAAETPPSSVEIEALEPGTDHRDPRVRARAQVAMLLLGHDAERHWHGLVDVLTLDDNRSKSNRAASYAGPAINRLVDAGRCSIEQVTAALEERRTRKSIASLAFILGNCGADAATALPALRAARRHPDPPSAVDRAIRRIEHALDSLD